MKNDMSSRGATAALVLAGALTAGCAGEKGQNTGTQGERGPNTGTQVVQKEVCTYYSNVWGPDPKDPNGTAYFPKNIIRPVVSDCSTSISSGGLASGVIQYERSESMKNPNAGLTREGNLSESEQQILMLVDRVNPKVKPGKNVRPFVAAIQTPTIQITGGNILASASVEGEKSLGDRSLFMPSSEGNKSIAKQRAADIYSKFLATLARSGVSVTGQDKITTKTQVLPLEDAEFGALARAEIVPNKEDKPNPVMEHIAKANAGGAKSQAYKDIIEARRVAKIELEYKATGVRRVIDVSTAGGVAAWGAVLTLLGGLGFGVKTLRDSKK